MTVLAEAVVRLRRRALGGSPGAPSTMRSTELAYNEVDNTLYVGVGDDGDGNALSVKAVTGSVSFDDLEDKPATFPPSAHTHAAGDVTSGTFDAARIPALAISKTTGLQSALNGKATAAQGALADTAVQPAGLTKAAVGLGNVDNTSDLAKPISTATQNALNAKAGTAVATTTVNGLMIAADKVKLNGIEAGAQVNPGVATTSANGLMSSADKSKLNGIAAGATSNTGTVTSVAMAVPTGFGVTGAITTSGTLTLTYAAGYKGYTTAEANKLSGIQAGAQVNPGVATTSANGLMASADKTKLNGIASSADVTATAVAPAIFAASAKTTPVDADTVGITDSAASNALKKVTWANIKATLKAYFDTLYAAVSHTHTVSQLSDATANGRSLISSTNYASMRGLLDLEAGTDFYSMAGAEAAFQPIPTSSSYAVGTLLLCGKSNSGTLANGATIAGSNLGVIFVGTDGLVDWDIALSGTWRNVSSGPIGQYVSGYFVRTA